MQTNTIFPENVGWLHTELDKEHMDFLWRMVKKYDGKASYKQNLAGNISRSEVIVDKGNYFFVKVLIPHYMKYYNDFGGHPIRNHARGELEIRLQDFWVNYQYQNEFNPYHHHGGVYSFVVWMKIPTEWGEQHSLEFLNGMKPDDRKASNFEFEYMDSLGGIRNFGYKMDSTREGQMLFFPAALRHTVYPFYNCEEPRITISGNLWLKPKNESN